LRKLRTLEINGQSTCSLAALRGHPTLRWLAVHYAHALDGISHLPALEALDLSWSYEFTDLSPLSDLPALKLLNLSLTHRLRDIAPLARLPSLECVVLLRTGVLDFAPLSALPKLRRLSLGEYESMSGAPDSLATLPVLRQAPALEELDLRKRPLETAAPLAGMPALKHLSLTRCKGLHDVTALASIPTLEEIDLGFCEGVTDIDALAELPKLQRVWVRRTGVTKSSVNKKLRERCDWGARDREGEHFWHTTQLTWSFGGPKIGV
jgi:internalin A